MGSLQAFERDTDHPLEMIEGIAHKRGWAFERPVEDEIYMFVEGGWSDLQVAINWRSDLESLLLACMYGDKVPATRHEEMARLVAISNEQLFHGHFDLWAKDGTLVYRNALVLAGGARANDAQCEMLIRTGVATCQRYFPAVQFVTLAGMCAEQALESSLFETVGEA